MKNKSIIWGIILLFVLLSIHPMVIGLDNKLIKPSNYTNDGMMDSAWPTFGHDNRHTCQSPYNTADNPGLIKWKFLANSGFHSSPVIDNDGVLYIGCKDGFLYAINQDGTEQWHYNCRGWILSSPALAEDGTIYVGSFDNNLYAIYPNGSLKWKFHAEGSIWGSPTIDEEGIIYFGSLGSESNGKIYALYPNGSEKWQFNTDNSIYETPAIGEDGTIYITSNDKYLYALSPLNGSLFWRFRTGDGLGSPTVGDDGIIYVASLDDYLYAVFPNGTMKWRVEIDTGSSDTPAIAIDGTIYIGGFYFYAVNPDGSIKWIYQGWEPYEYECTSRTYAISADNIVYFVTTKHGGWGGDLIALNEDGILRWRKTISAIDDQFSSPIIDKDGTVYVGSQFGEFGSIYGNLFAFGSVENNSPPEKPGINGSSVGKIGEEQKYTFIVFDINYDEVYLWVDWGDNTNTSWIGPYNSSEEIILPHTWNIRGSYTISAKAKDMHDVEGEWASLEVRMPRFNQYFHQLYWFHYNCLKEVFFE